MGNSKDWFNFFLTFTATAAGAGVGVLGLRWQFHRESRERYETQLTDRLFRVNEEMLARGPSIGGNRATEVWEVYLALNNVSMMAKNADREMVLLLSDACNPQNCSSQKEVSDLFGFLIGIITGWRSQTNSFDYFLGRVKERIGREKPENKESIPPVS